MSTIKEQIGEYLASEGLRPQEEDYGFYFRYQMLNFFIRWDEDDALLAPDRDADLPLEEVMNLAERLMEKDENNRTDVLEAANKVNRSRKVVKCLVLDDVVWLVTEQLLDSDPNFVDVIPRSLDMLLQAREAFYQGLREI